MDDLPFSSLEAIEQAIDEVLCLEANADTAEEHLLRLYTAYVQMLIDAVDARAITVGQEPLLSHSASLLSGSLTYVINLYASAYTRFDLRPVLGCSFSPRKASKRSYSFHGASEA